MMEEWLGEEEGLKEGDGFEVGLPDSQSRNTGDFWTRKRVPMATNVVLVVVLVLLLDVIIVIRFPVPKALSFLNRS